MKAILCDQCGEIINGEQKKECLAECDTVSVVMKIEDDRDLCGECSRKLFAKAAYSAWCELKQTRKPKGKNDGD